MYKQVFDIIFHVYRYTKLISLAKQHHSYVGYKLQADTVTSMIITHKHHFGIVFQ